MKTERELFLGWHFLQWKLNNAATETVDFAKVLYDRVYSHDHTSSVREVEFKAWIASAQREGYKLVPVQDLKHIRALNKEIESADKDYLKEITSTTDRLIKAMIGGVE